MLINLVGLDDLCVRFIINLPREELESVERICFQVEESQWFYEDFIRPLDPDLPSLNLRNFCLLIFQHCPMLSAYSSYDHAQAFSEFLAYKTRVPVRGAILLNEKMDEVLLVKGWKKGANWSFPRGKINKDEADLDCAIREVYEETGYDVNGAGLVPKGGKSKHIEMNLREQHMRLYVFRGVPRDTYFEPRTRKEISKIQWWKLSDLPTLRKKKQQQDNHGGDLAINANKFYMVAPFMPQLKKWISAQRRWDKTRQTSISAPVPTATDEEATAVLDHVLEEEMTQPPLNEDMDKLLEGLRQSAQPVKPCDLPEATDRAGAAEAVAAQLKNFLRVPTGPPVANEPVKKSQVPELVNNPKADSLLALLQSKPTQSLQLPQTPMEQVIELPRLPSSPPHRHHQPQRFSSMPPPPVFPIQNRMVSAEPQRQQLPQPPQVRPISPPQQPAQLVPQHPRPQSNKPPSRTNLNQAIRAPYQRTGDPQFAQYAQVPGIQSSSVPRASRLPPLKLNAQSSALLSLFKADLPVKAGDVNGHANVLGNITRRAAIEVPTFDEIQKVGKSHREEDVTQAPNQDKSRQTSRSTNMFVPPQVFPKPQSGGVAKVSSSPKAGHQDKLLNLFRDTSVPIAEPAKPATPTLQLPSAPIELSALPTTPGHSREPSKYKESVKEQVPLPIQYGLMESGKNSRHRNASSQNPPVSATISGPLNIPQFEMVAKTSKEAKQAGPKKDFVQSSKRSPITILARPTSSHGQSPATNQSSPAQLTSEAEQPNTVAPKVQTLVTPVKKPPPTPDLKGHEAPPKAFHPQILRRPAHLDDASEPSPIQPLPSPKHNVLADRRPNRPADHKKSLLSLFTKPSPAVSPPSAAPVSAIDPSALISPLTGPTPKEQAEAAFARLSGSVGKLSHEPEKAPQASQLPLLRTGNINSAVADGSKMGRSNEKQTSTSKTTPTDKAFLLGFLNSVAEGGR